MSMWSVIEVFPGDIHLFVFNLLPLFYDLYLTLIPPLFCLKMSPALTAAACI